MANKRNRQRKDRNQLAFDLDSILKALEDSFVMKLGSYFKRVTNNIAKKINNLPLFVSAISTENKKDISQLKKLLEGYYKKIGKETIKQTNKEIQELSGKRSVIKIPDINEGLRYRAEQLAKQKIKDYNKEIREKILSGEGSLKDKKEVISNLKKAQNSFINRHVTIVSRMESVTVANQQRLEAFRKSTIITAVQFLAVMDNRTTPICTSRHNMVIRLDDPLLPNFTPPCHFGCRSILSGVTIFEKLKPTSLNDLQGVPKTQFQEIEVKNKRKEDLKEINKLRDKKVNDLSLLELRKISTWEVENAKKILEMKDDFKPYIRDGSGTKRLLSITQKKSSELDILLSSSNSGIDSIKESYNNLKGKLRELQISHKMIIDKNYNVDFLGEQFGKFKQEVDIGFNKNSIYFIGEIKSGKVNRDYFNDLNQGSNLIKTALDKDMTLVFFFDNNIDEFKVFLEKQDLFKNNPKLKYKLIDSKLFLFDYANF